MKSSVELTHKNHFRFGYGGESFALRREASEIWTVSYGSCDRSPGNFGYECVETAKLIASKTNEQIWVAFSGGIDSEVTLASFVRAGVPVRAAIMRYVPELNDHDTHFAVQACQRMGVDYRFFDLNLESFWRNDLFTYAMAAQSPSPQFPTTMWLIDQIDGYVVLGSGENFLAWTALEDGEKWCLIEKEKVASWYKHFIVRNRNGCPGFFQYTPEIMLASLQEPIMQQLTSARPTHAKNSSKCKHDLYSRHFDLQPRPKYTGFEKLEAMDAELRSELRRLLPGCESIYRRPVDELLSDLAPPSFQRSLSFR